MKLFLFSLIFLIIGSLMNIVFNNYFQIGGLKLNWLLVFVLVLSFRHSKLLISFVGIIAGLICDAHSHGIMGLYGTSFFITLLIVIQVKKIFYSNTFISVSLAILGMTIIEILISQTILGWFEPDIKQASSLYVTYISLAILHGLITPIILQLIIWGENIFLREVA